MKETKTMTPMLEQYYRLKAEQPDALLMFRLGDFYELFDTDAEQAAPLLDLQLTSRDGRVAMCGVPHHAVNQYSRRLLEQGLTVAIAEQMEDPSQAKGLVNRQIVRVLTPGTVIPDDEGRAPRLGVLYRHRQGWVALVAELSTGACHVAECSLRKDDRQNLADLWAVWSPDEYLTNDSDEWPGGVKVDGAQYFRRGEPLELERLVSQKLGVAGLRRWGLQGRTEVHEALAALWRYLESTQRRSPSHLTDMRVYRLGQRVGLSPRSLTQLDLIDGPYSLWKQLNQTVTPMGARRLSEWIAHPLQDADAIMERQRAVTYWVQQSLERAELRDLLKGVGDLGRRVARVTMGLGRPRDVEGIRAALIQMPAVREALERAAVWPFPDDVDAASLAHLAEQLDVLADPVPARWEDTPLIRLGIEETIDESRRLLEDQRQALLALEERERERSGIKSLRVGYHRTFGYYLEVARSQAKTVPDDWHRRQTTAHTERFVSEALRDLERAIQEAESRLETAERAWEARLESLVLNQAAVLTSVSAWLAELDVLAGLAEAAARFGYHAPEFRDGEQPVVIEELRHPVLERLMRDYVTSTLELSSAHQTLIITGPNMGGKSTFMRALAQNAVMAQMGGWVAARVYRAPVFDAILTRMGADDDLVRGQSTFMVEMEEVAAILNQATGRSLVLLDELGRGTSTYDGLAIAQAVVERLALAEGPLTLFATHYHELTGLSDIHQAVSNLTVEVLEGPQGPIFTHRVIPGQASRSYGIEVARMAGLPSSLIRRAEQHLRGWENGPSGPSPEPPQLTFYAPDPETGPLVESLRALSPDDLSPREAWLWLAEWHGRLEGKAK